MAYRGRPSTACERCRSRRMKCDHGVPSCTQCIRARVDCPGYRNALDLKFRDQSQEVIRHCRAPARKKRQGTSTDTPSRESTAAAATTIIPNGALVHSVQQNLARRYIFANYMTGGSRCGHMAYLLPLIEDPQNMAVNTALDAVALAAFSNIRLSPRTMLRAQREYTAVLSRTNRALRDPILCKTDDTLAAVVLLGIYEVIACTDNSYIDRWVQHVDGAAKLIEIRGQDQLTRRAGLEMFTHLRTQIILSRIFQERYISSALAHLNEQVQKYRNSEDKILDQLSSITIRLADFCADVKSKSIAKPSDIIRTALSIDADLVSLLISVPRPWSYISVQVPTVDGKYITKDVWGSHYHIYDSIAAASMWNNYRSARIVVQELIYDTLKYLEGSNRQHSSSSTNYPQQGDLAGQCRRTILQLADDICASVPFHFQLGANDDVFEDYLSGQPGASGDPASATTPLSFLATSSSPSTSPNLRNAAPSLDAEARPTSMLNSSGLTSSQYLSSHTPSPFEVVGAGGFTLMWPLLVAANSGVASGLRGWIITCLDKIGYSMGINQALAMAKLLREGLQSRAWLSPDYESPNHET
ncbi:hypothetical protein F5Y10DRAFT_255475 [Nemania abortiva]|nr:hypothetical protein F5Y10DRAFT_255475 [Nemania abortiva]